MTEIALLQALLAAEHAAIYGYGVIGARLSGDLLAQAQAADDAHRSRRTALTEQLRDRAASAPATKPAYDVAAADQPAALGLAVRLEEGLAARWRDLVAGTDDRDLRSLAVAGLTESAVRAAQWRVAAGPGPATVALPGTP